MAIFDVTKENKAKSHSIESARNNKERYERIAKVAAVDNIRTLGKEYKDLAVVQLRVLLATLKRKGDTDIPSRRVKIISRLTIAEHRDPLAKERAVNPTSSSVTGILSNANKDKED